MFGQLFVQTFCLKTCVMSAQSSMILKLPKKWSCDMKVASVSQYFYSIHFYEIWNESCKNRPFSYSENECGSNDISSQFLELSNVHNCDRSPNATKSNLAYKIV